MGTWRRPEELPEQVFAAARLSYADFKKVSSC